MSLKEHHLKNNIVALSEEDYEAGNIAFCKGCMKLYDGWPGPTNEPMHENDAYHAITIRQPGEYTLRILRQCPTCDAPTELGLTPEQYAWVAEPTSLVCPSCTTSEHVEALHGTKHYGGEGGGIVLPVIELYCRLHKIQVAAFVPVVNAIDHR